MLWKSALLDEAHKIGDPLLGHGRISQNTEICVIAGQVDRFALPRISNRLSNDAQVQEVANHGVEQVRLSHISRTGTGRGRAQRHDDRYAQLQTLFVNGIQALVVRLQAEPMQGQMGRP